jgi:8-oxo-dGTP diphosphatase
MPASDQGVQLHRYQLIPRTLIFLTHRDQVLLIKGSPQKPIWANLYNGLGGHVEQQEDITSSAQRELFEECGLIVKELWLAGLITIDTGKNPGIIVFVFRADLSSEHPLEPPVLHTSPEGELEWMQTDQLNSLPLVEDLPIILPKALAVEPQSTPFIARYSYDFQGKLNIEFTC